MAFAFMPPAIPGLGNAGGFSFWLQDRSGGSVEFLDQNLQKFLAAARKRPELAGVDVAVLRRRAADLRRRRSRQGAEAGRGRRRCLSDAAGLPRRTLSEPVQPLRPAVARVPPGGRRRAPERPRTSATITCGTTTATMVPLSALVTTRSISGPEYTNRFNLYRAAQVIGGAAPGYSSGQAMAALEEVAQRGAAAARWATTGPISLTRRSRLRGRR